MAQDQNSSLQDNLQDDLQGDLQDILEMDNDNASDEASALNRLNQLANQAIELKLISAHGYHQGQYELLRNGKFILMTPIEAVHYLEELIATTGV
jgi:hypothetical protein